MQNFLDNTDINNLIYQYIKKITYKKYTDDIYDCAYFNSIDRIKSANEIAKLYFQRNDYNSIGGKKNEEDFINYIAIQIDKLIPIFCFMESNKKLSNRYNTLLIRRIFITHGKDYFPITENINYVYEHDFSKEKEYIKKTLATPKQLEYLKQMAGEQGFILINEEYMSKEIAQKIILYLKGSLETEPRLFSFFMITV